ncbi:hypothetical protein AAFF_G00363110 [Aldrovandia affinis]|uniref:Uncharacterized protein n=1 Tax=Aldrovandia affinis TaxID=143900 RepID=A0AAD7R4V8_9TELE|nr:hypothetical protein AAFF_G00363110 [Aldrovandia affinis]
MLQSIPEDLSRDAWLAASWKQTWETAGPSRILRYIRDPGDGLKPACADMENLKRKEQRYRQKQQQNYNRRHRAHDMPHLQPGDHVWVKDMLQRGTVVSTADTPRSYLIETPRGTLRRNRFHLSPTSVAPETPLQML